METEKLIADETIELKLGQIRRDGGTQSREAMNWRHVELLREQLDDGMVLEPVIIFFDGDVYWLADGFHRWYAVRNQGLTTIQCRLKFGARRDAVLYAVGANADHRPALPRTRHDKRKSATILLLDREWSKWSDSEIARRCRVSQPFVSKLRASLRTDDDGTRLYMTRYGRPARMKTGNIGKVATDPAKETNGSLIDRLYELLATMAQKSEPPSQNAIFRLIDAYPTESLLIYQMLKWLPRNLLGTLEKELEKRTERSPTENGTQTQLHC